MGNCDPLAPHSLHRLPSHVPDQLVLIGVGFLAGLLGGIAGVGGSILILPALALIYGNPRLNAQHTYMAAAMTVNVVVAIPAAIRHFRHGAIRTDLLPLLIPATALSLAAGVVLSNWFPGYQLQLLLGLFVLGYSGSLLIAVITRRSDHAAEAERTTAPRLLSSASITGLTAGLLGLGGGILQVPLLQSLCRVPLRRAIATSSAVICLTAFIGAGLKLGTLSSVDESAVAAIWLALPMLPSAVVGGWLGARLTHTLPLGLVRGIIAAVLIVAGLSLVRKGVQAAGWWG